MAKIRVEPEIKAEPVMKMEPATKAMPETKVEPVIPAEPGITLNEYLANYSGNRNLDKPITLWYQRKDPMNTLRGKGEWDNLIKEFYAEK